MKQPIIFISLLVSFSSTQAMMYYLEPDEIQRMEKFYADEPVTFTLLACCTLTSPFWIHLAFRVRENAPSYEIVKTKTVQCLTSYCKKINPIPRELVKAHENGMVKTLFGKPPKQLKME